MISILMPIYNGIEYITDSVVSVLIQDYTEWELLIGINGHPENSPVYLKAKEFEKKSNKIRVFDFHTIKGKSNTLNEMIKYCNYDYVALLDVDDIWYVNKLSIQLPFLKKYDVVGSRCVWFENRDGTIPNIPTGDITNFDFFSVNPIINSSVIVKKNLAFWNDIVVEDYELWLRLKQQDKKFYNCNEIIVKHRIHNDSFFNTKDNSKVIEKIKEYYGSKKRNISVMQFL